MRIKKINLLFGLVLSFLFCAQIAKAQDPISTVGAGVEGVTKGVGGAVNNVAQGAGKGVTDVLDNVTGNKAANPSAPAAAPVAVHHHHHHHHHHH